MDARTGILRAAVVVGIWFSLAFQAAGWGQALEKTQDLGFSCSLSKQFYSRGESVVANLEFWSMSAQPLYVSRLQEGKFVTFSVLGPDGKGIPWQGGRADAKRFSASDFTVLNQYTGIKGSRILSLNKGKGFGFDRPGEYTLTAEFSMEPSDRFAAAAGQATTPVGVFQAKAFFCIEACISERLSVSDQVPPSALRRVREFYDIITKYQQLGLPDDPEKQALQPLLSRRLRYLLDDLEGCEADYDRRFGERDRAETLKPEIPWLEEGLFTGSDEAATTTIYQLGTSRLIGKDRVDAEVLFTIPQENCRDESPCDLHYRGVVTLIRENSHWVVDDYIAMDGDLRRLSSGYPECRDNH